LRAHQRPAAAKRADDRMKLHRHVVPCGGRDYTVITLRPGARPRFSGNYYHGTWHILSDPHGARVLARLLWGLAYQRMPGTLVLIDRPQLDTDPFNAEPADPIALVPSRLTSLSDKAARQLRARLPLTRPTGTVRWQTPGLDRALAERGTAAGAARMRRWRYYDRPGDEHVARVGGLVVFAGLPHVLLQWAAAVHMLGDHPGSSGMDYAYLRGADGWVIGEVQVFSDYRQRVSSATVARREILSTIPQQARDIRPLIWERATAVRRR
jgi:hypothetical protein